MGKNGETNKNIPWKWMMIVTGAVLFFMLLLLLGIRAGRQRAVEERDYLEKLQEEQETAEKRVFDGKKGKEQKERKAEDTVDLTTSQKTSENEEKKQVTDGEKQSIRVLISVDGTENYLHPEVRISCPEAYQVSGDITVQQDAGTELRLSEQMQPGQVVYVEATETGIPLTLESVSRTQGAPSYQGILEVRRQEQGFRIINEVDLESYLKGVVPSEMPADAPTEALCAQAVCARTYALRQMEEKRMKQWDADVDDTVSCQVYNNIPEQTASNQAVDATSGMVMLCDGEPIEAYFFSTSWGYTDTDVVWDAKKKASYLKSVAVSRETVETMTAAWNEGKTQPGKTLYENSQNPENMSEECFREQILQVNVGDYEKEDVWYRWKVRIPWEVLKERSEKQWTQIGTFTGVSIQERNPGGGVKKLEIQGEKGNMTLENEYTIRKFLAVKGMPVIRNDGSTCDTMELLPSACFIIDKEQETDVFVLTGGGYGHGVGMSQNGAKHLAENGMNWKEILQLFYRDIAIENLQES